jgi:lipopolysaccharide/colanic/teichoic acid biosynthesis glycosyltransferase
MYRKFFKRFLDIVLSLIGLVFLAVAFVFVAPAIYIEDRGPIFYNGKRIGRNGVLYPMHKFRSMMVNAPDIRLSDGSTYNGKDDPRVTKVGRVLRETSLDELPQLWNVLKGEMSLIGPRPDPPDWLDKYPADKRSFLTVRPGITGYSQAYYRNSDEANEKLEHDCFYAENLSFKLDVKILLKTVQTVLKHDNLYREETSEQS